MYRNPIIHSKYAPKNTPTYQFNDQYSENAFKKYFFNTDLKLVGGNLPNILFTIVIVIIFIVLHDAVYKSSLTHPGAFTELLYLFTWRLLGPYGPYLPITLLLKVFEITGFYLGALK